MNRLTLCQQTAFWSAKAQPSVITSTLNQIGVPLQIVNAVDAAWLLIQTLHDNWQWLRAEFSANLAAVVPPAQGRWTPAALGITRFADWVYDQIAAPSLSGNATYRPMTIYSTSIGVSDEGPIKFMDWELFRQTYFRNAQVRNRPTNWSSDPQGNFCLGQAPDVPYTAKGEFFKSPQTMAADGDTPEMPSPFHMAIVWRAVLLLTERDEAEQLVYDRAENKYAEIIGHLENSQLPHIVLGGSPIA